MVLKVLQSFLSPSVFVFGLIIFGTLFIFLKKIKIGKILLISGLLIFYLFSITPISDLLIRPLERQYLYPSEKKINSIDTMVVLSGGVKNKDLPLPSVFGDSMLFRLEEALKLYYLKTEKPFIIISGTSPIDMYSKEALFGRSFLELFGVSDDKVMFDLMSENTFEHALELKKIVGKKEFLLVTSAYHMPRSMEVFKKAGLNPTAVPTDYRLEGYYTVLDFFPRPDSLKKSHLSVHEYLGILYYRVFK
jgi:uncharacterized SAM-binding protein YcdF (DUF218 family)